MDGFLSTEGPTVEQAITSAAVISDCAPDEIAYHVVESAQQGATKIIATSLVSARGLQGLNRGDRLPPNWQRDLVRRWTVLAAESGSAADYPGAVDALLLQPTLRPPPLLPLKIIQGDVSAGHGKVTHSGDLNIHGNVAAAAEVQARGRIIVFGNVGRSATVTASKQVVILGGTLGSIRSITGDVQCGFAQNCSVAGQAITIRGDAVQCRLLAANSLDVAGAIDGGSAYGEQEVQAMTIGAFDPKVKTSVQVGGSLRLRRLVALATRCRDSAGKRWLADFYAENILRMLDAAGGIRPHGRICVHRELRPPAQLALGINRVSIEESAGPGTFWVDDDTGACMTRQYGRE